MRLPIFDRTDYALTVALLVLVSLVTPLLLVLLPLVQWLGGGAFHWELSGVGTSPAPAGLSPRDGVTLTGGDTVDVQMAHAGAAVWTASLLPGLLLSAAVIIVCWQLVRLVASTGRRQPFVDASVRALRFIAVTVASASVAHGLVTGIADSVVAAHALTGDKSASFTFPLVGLLVALLVLVVAEAFAHGARLQEDVEGLV